MLEAHTLEHGLNYAFLRCAEFNEFEAVEADGVFEQIIHGFICNLF